MLENYIGNVRLIGIPKNKKESQAIKKPVSLTKEVKTINEPRKEEISKIQSDEELFKPRKYPFYSSSDDIVPEAVACFRIIADTLDIPLKVDLIKRSFSENISEEEKRVNLRLCAAISESLGLKSQLLDLPVAMISRVQTPCLVQLGEDELAVILEIKNSNITVARPRKDLETFKLTEFVNDFASQENIPVLILKTTNKTPKKRFGLEMVFACDKEKS